MCQKFPVQFGFIAGKNNPADCVTRCISYKQLLRSTFLVGPDLSNMLSKDNLGSEATKVALPNPQMMPAVNLVLSEGSERSDVFHCDSDVPLTSCSVGAESSGFLLDSSHFSNFRRLVSLRRKVLICVQKWKTKVGLSDERPKNTFAEATTQVIKADQKKISQKFLTIFKVLRKVHVLFPLLSLS